MQIFERGKVKNHSLPESPDNNTRNKRHEDRTSCLHDDDGVGNYAGLINTI